VDQVPAACTSQAGRRSGENAKILTAPHNSVISWHQAIEYALQTTEHAFLDAIRTVSVAASRSLPIWPTMREASSITIGVALGVAIGAAIDNIGLGIGIGIALSLALGLVFRPPK
jgi:hypothetical protein